MAFYSEIRGRSSGGRNAYPDDGNYDSNSYGLNWQHADVPLVPDKLTTLRHEFRLP